MKKLRFDFNQIGDQIKNLEDQFETYLIPGLPVVARLDGKSFHMFTKGLDKPYDVELSQVMHDLVKWLCETFNASVGYTQSDEITLVFDNPIQDTASMQTIFFDGRVEKICSILAAKTSVKFNQLISKYEKFDSKLDSVPVFDCRVFSCPTQQLLRNSVVWRQMDCRKNAVSMAAHANFSHKSLQNKNSREKIELLFQKGINFADYPAQFRNGLFFIRRKAVRVLTAEELQKIPEKYREYAEAVERTVYSSYTDVVLTKLDPDDIDTFLFMTNVSEQNVTTIITPKEEANA
jgi:tRNA(His) 5'-end guanylyltransferase